MRVCLLGLGYVGLPTAVVLANNGMCVHGVDTNSFLIKKINDGTFTSTEPDLDLSVLSAVKSGNLEVSQVPVSAEVFIVAVPTPVLSDNSGADLSAVKKACKSLSKYLKPGNLIILESTVPVGTIDLMAEWISGVRGDLTFSNTNNKTKNSNRIYLAHCPERVFPGKIMRELIENDRTVGGIDIQSAQRASDFYSTFVKGRITLTNARTAELSKLVENAYRDVNIAFANEISLICDDLNVNVWDLIDLVNQHPRVNVLSPGAGVGGHCVAVDPWFIVASSPARSKLVRTSREVNDFKPNYVIQSIKSIAENRGKLVIGCLGITFKRDVEDVRGSPALHIVETLAKDPNYEILVVEPNLMELPGSLSQFENIKLVSLPQALKEAQLLALLVNHQDFYSIDQRHLVGKSIIDTCGVWRDTSAASLRTK